MIVIQWIVLGRILALMRVLKEKPLKINVFTGSLSGGGGRIGNQIIDHLTMILLRQKHDIHACRIYILYLIPIYYKIVNSSCLQVGIGFFKS